MIVGITPVRISFAGGGTDMPEYYEKFGGNVISSTINRFTYAVIQSRNDDSFQSFSPDLQKHYKPTSFNKIIIEDGTEIASSVIKYLKYKKGLNVILFTDVSAGSGLGASSSLAVNLINSINHLKGKKMNEKKTAETAYEIGRKILHWPIGKQDEYISAFGGFNFIKFTKNKITVIPIKMKKKSLNELQQNLLLFSLGYTRNNTKILTSQINSINEKDRVVFDSLLNVKNIAREMYTSLKKSDLTNFGELLNKGWNEKKKFAKNITNPKIEKIYKKALSNGAIGGKLTGAGGGGHMLFYCEPKKQKLVVKAMINSGLKLVNFKFHNNGPQIVDPITCLNKKFN